MPESDLIQVVEQVDTLFHSLQEYPSSRRLFEGLHQHLHDSIDHLSIYADNKSYPRIIRATLGETYEVNQTKGLARSSISIARRDNEAIRGYLFIESGYFWWKRLDHVIHSEGPVGGPIVHGKFPESGNWDQFRRR